MRARLFVILVALVGPPLEAQEASPIFSGQASAEAGERPGSLTLLTNAGVDLSWGALSGQFVGGIGLKEGRVSWDWSSAWLAVQGDWAEIKLGLWADPRGPSAFRTLVPGFTSGSGTELLATAGTALPPTPGKVRVRLVAEEWSWSGELAAWRPAPSLPDTTSEWFPIKDLPTTIPVLNYPRRDVRSAPGASGAREPWPVRTELRWSALWGETVLGAYHGDDPQVLYPARLLLAYDQELLDVFDIVVSPRPSPTTVAWLTLEVPWGPGKLWSEQRLTRDRLKTVPGYVFVPPDALEQKTTTTHVWEGLWGGSVSVSTGRLGVLRLWSEASVYYDLANPEERAPDFTTGWVGGLSWEDSQGFTRVDVLLGAPWDPVQGWLWSRATWNWMEGRTLWLGVPVFWGGTDTMWGQFSNRKVWAVGMTWEQ